VIGPQRRQAVIFSNKYDEFMGLFPPSIPSAAAATAFSVIDFNYMPLSSIACSLRRLSDNTQVITTAYSRAIWTKTTQPLCEHHGRPEDGILTFGLHALLNTLGDDTLKLFERKIKNLLALVTCICTFSR
jgi:hypothetical protein